MKFTVTILLKGNSTPIILKGVLKFNVKYQGDEITKLEWELAPGQQLLYISLSDIAFVYAEEEKEP